MPSSIPYAPGITMNPELTNYSGFASTGSGGSTGSAGGSFVTPPLTQPQGDIYSRLLEMIGGGPNIQGFIDQGMNSPLLQSILNPALAVQNRQFANQRQNVTDAMRAAGGLRSSQYGVNLNRLQGDQGIAQGNLMAQIIAQTLSPLLNAQMEAYKSPIGAYNTLFANLPGAKYVPPQPSASGGSSGGFGSADRSMGGGRPTGPSGGGYAGYGNPAGGGAPSNPNDYGLGYAGGNFGNLYEPGNPIAYNPNSGSYETYNPNQPYIYSGPTGNYTDYGDLVRSYGLNYDPTPQNGELPGLQYNYPDQSGYSLYDSADPSGSQYY